MIGRGGGREEVCESVRGKEWEEKMGGGEGKGNGREVGEEGGEREI